ncbi:MAG: hypothetical protein CMD39_08450 [Gammaproteobacteria bacterium]|nr:hypothetical protein [Gammaproteobacteria bacterium]
MTIRTLAWLAALAPLSAAALAPGDRVENFSLLDHRGDAHELYYFSDQDAVVIMAHSRRCDAVDPAVAQLSGAGGDGAAVTTLLLNSDLDDDREALAGSGTALPILLDDTQIIGESLDLDRAGEALIIDPDTWSVAYRGAIGEGFDAALAAVVAGEPVAAPQGESGGCAIAFPERERRDAHAAISYSDTIAPILADNCVACHREGGIGPWAMTRYDMVRGFAPMIREVLRTRRMPPWHADPHYGEFRNDRSLTPDEKRTLVHWIEAGAPRGDGPDPLAADDHQWPEWQLGEPDLVVDIPAFEVPATGVVDYMYPRVENPHGEDAWVRAVEILPGSRQALHHVITTFGMRDPEARYGFRELGSLGGYVPGADADVFAEGTGVLLPADGVIQFQMHYTTFGKAVVDASRLGIYFHDDKPEHALQTTVLMNPRIRIPANTKAHSDSAETVIERDILVYNLLPHAHYRGKASEFTAVYPDGREEVLLSVPDYDFNWQTTYELAEPKFLPAGTRIVHTTTWDNSAQNPANPDPNREVPWGQQSWDEMLFGAIRWRYADEGTELAMQTTNGE